MEPHRSRWDNAFRSVVTVAFIATVIVALIGMLLWVGAVLIHAAWYMLDQGWSKVTT